MLFTARDGATLSGHVWATWPGRRVRPGVVITDGSVQADEQMYWYAAQALAKDGYVVLTFDPQGQGQSDIFGAGEDALEGVPAQTDGRPFYDGTEDALNFFLSTPTHRMSRCRVARRAPVTPPNRTPRARRIRHFLRPVLGLADRSEIGLAGHSYGAAGVSYIAQWDPRVKAVVAWDNLGTPDSKGAGPSVARKPCPADPAARTAVPITKPGLGMSADYGLPPLRTLAAETRREVDLSHAYTAAGVDTGEIIIRGGSHLDFSFIPNVAFGASLRGADLIAWYTDAWFDKYLKHDPSADGRLLTTRWQHDPIEKEVDPEARRKRVFVLLPVAAGHPPAPPARCSTARTFVRAVLAWSANDGYPGMYSYLNGRHQPGWLTGTFGQPAGSTASSPSSDQSS